MIITIEQLGGWRDRVMIRLVASQSSRWSKLKQAEKQGGVLECGPEGCLRWSFLRGQETRALNIPSSWMLQLPRMLTGVVNGGMSSLIGQTFGG